MKNRRYIVAYCELCSTAKTFVGPNVKSISKKIDDSGWRDAPKGDGIGFVCSGHTEREQADAICSWMD